MPTEEASSFTLIYKFFSSASLSTTTSHSRLAAVCNTVFSYAATVAIQMQTQNNSVFMPTSWA